MNLQGKNMVITGASSGIGETLAYMAATKGCRVGLVARREERLQELAENIQKQGGKADVFPADLTSPVEREALYGRIKQAWKHVDVWVNNAGIGWYGHITDLSPELAERLIELNVQAPVHFTLLALPDMLERQSGQLIQVGSIAGDIPSQGVAAYAASKSFIDDFNTALHRELKYSGVTATVIKPGPVKTEFFERAISQEGGRAVPAEKLAIRSDRVAAGILRAIEHPRRTVYIPWYVALVHWVELIFSPIIDALGPLLLKREDRRLEKTEYAQNKSTTQYQIPPR